MRTILCAAGLMVLLTGCGGSGVGPIGLSADTLRQTPRSVVVGGQTLTMTTDLWRDLMPIVVDPGTPSPVRGVIAHVRIAGAPSDLAVTSVALVHGMTVVSQTPAANETGYSDGILYATARTAEVWPIGDAVDVVATLTRSDGAQYQVRADGQIVAGAY
jgi:hypothetical protein